MLRGDERCQYAGVLTKNSRRRRLPKPDSPRNGWTESAFQPAGMLHISRCYHGISTEPTLLAPGVIGPVSLVQIQSPDTVSSRAVTIGCPFSHPRLSTTPGQITAPKRDFAACRIVFHVRLSGPTHPVRTRKNQWRSIFQVLGCASRPTCPDRTGTACPCRPRADLALLLR